LKQPKAPSGYLLFALFTVAAGYAADDTTSGVRWQGEVMQGEYFLLVHKI